VFIGYRARPISGWYSERMRWARKQRLGARKGVQRQRAPTLGGMEAHECERDGLVQRLEPPQSFRVPDGRRQNPALLEQGDHATQRAHQELVQPAPNGLDPLVVALRQQIAGVERDAASEGRDARLGTEGRPLLQDGADGGFEPVHVQHERRVGDPPDQLAARFDEAVRVGDRGAHVVNQLPEVGEGLRLGRVGPEQEGEMPPIDRPVTVQQEIG
jgi:hypothetical protein